jgi:hypothetical protein
VCAVVVPGAAAQTDDASSGDSDTITAAFEADAARILPRSDGTMRLVLTDVAKDASVKGAPKGVDVDPHALWEADADGEIVARLEAEKGPKGSRDVDLVLTDVEHLGEGLIVADAELAEEPVVDGSDLSLPPHGDLEDVTLSAEIDLPADDPPPDDPPPGAPPKPSNYTITMQWRASQIEDLTTWTFEPLHTICINAARDTRRVEVQYPEDGGSPWAETTYQIEVLKTGPAMVDGEVVRGECAHGFSKLDFQITVGNESCGYRLSQGGKHWFDGNQLSKQSNVEYCAMTDVGIDIMSGVIVGTERG